jgi:OOP family OmpA-OmpF porin
VQLNRLAVLSLLSLALHEPASAQQARSFKDTNGAGEKSTSQILCALAGTCISRGIRAATVSTERTPANSQPQQPVRSELPQATNIDLVILFQSGSTDLRATAYSQLDKLGAALTDPSLSGMRFAIEGHTDTVGTPETNLSLSTRRAGEVAEYLIRKYSIDPGKLDARGKGKSDLPIQTGDQVDEPRNRIVRVIKLAG